MANTLLFAFLLFSETRFGPVQKTEKKGSDFKIATWLFHPQ